MLEVFEAFAGIGTQHMALKRLGVPFKVVGISEVEDSAILSYEAIHGKANNYGDISKIKPEELPQFDLFTYSFPCTDISLQGKELGLTEGSGTNSSLVWNCRPIIEKVRPKYLMMENVKNLISKKHKPEFDRWLAVLEEMGYKNYTKVINAKDGFVPQNRERVFCISILDGKEFTFPEGHNETDLRQVLEPDAYPPMYHNIYGGFKEKKARIFTDYSPTIRCAKGGGHLPSVCYFGDGYSGKFVEGNQVRQITPLEAWRLMDISDEDYYKAEATGLSKTKLYNQAGNSIVVGVLEAIFKELLL